MDWYAVESPIGRLGVAAVGDELSGVSFARGASSPRPDPLVEPVRPDPAGPGTALRPGGRPACEPEVVGRACRQLTEYFAGERIDFDLPLIITRGSEFERAVWQAIAAIPYGETLSYGAIARVVGEPGGAQAVGMACNRNPLPLVIACHRVIGSDGKLVGFGGGLDRKRFLLQLEARVHIERTFVAGLT